MKVTLGIVSSDGKLSQYTMGSIIDAIQEIQASGYEVELTVSQDSEAGPINYLLNRFLESDSEGILVIDGNAIFEASTALRLINSNRDFVSGVYPETFLNWERMLNKQTVDDLKSAGLTAMIGNPGDPVDGFAPVDSIGLKFFYVTRDALDVASASFSYRDSGRVFITSAREETWLTKEEFFCKTMTRAGYPPYVDIESPVVAIVGTMIYGA